MNIGDFLHSKRWRLIQNYIYSWGASVVLIGALFKLEHLPGASAFLGVGLSIEAIIFFVSAFEPLMENPDWKKVYPQLRTKDDEGLYDDSQPVPVIGTVTQQVQRSVIPTGINNLPEEQIKILNDSLQKLSETANGIKNLASATSANNEFVSKLNEATHSIGKVIDANEKISGKINESGNEFASSYKIAAENIKTNTEKVTSQVGQSITSIAENYRSASESISLAGKKMSKDMEQTAQQFSVQLSSASDQLKSSYKEMTDSLTGGFKNLDKNSGKYIENIEKMNKNLAALNAVYEIQLQGANKVESMVNEYGKGVAEVNKLVQKSIEETRKFNENTKEISENIQALNKVYGNMLGALNVKK